MSVEDLSFSRLKEKYKHLEDAGFFVLKEAQNNPSVGTQNLTFQCLKCLPKIKTCSCQDGAASNLRRHIKSLHGSCLAKFDVISKQRAKRGPAANVTLEPPMKQVKLFDVRTSRATQTQVNMAIQKFIVNTYQPFTLVRDTSFQDMIKTLDPSKSVPCYESLMKMIDTDFTNMKSTLIDIFSSVDYVSLTTDAWTAVHKSYMGFTCSWLTDDLTRENAVLGIRRLEGSHTYLVLAEAIDKILKEYKIQNKTIAMTTDGASNFGKCFSVFGAGAISSALNSTTDEHFVDIDEVLEDPDPDSKISLPRHLKCLSHSLSLVAKKDIEKATENSSYKRISKSFFGLAQRLWNFQDRSTKQSDKIREICNSLFTVPVVTRWNSVFNSVTDLKAKQDKLDDVMDALSERRFSVNEKVFMDEYLKCTRPIALALDKLQGQTEVSLGYVLPMLKRITEEVAGLRGKTRFCEPLIECTIEALDKRFKHLFNDNDYILAAVTSPMFKTRWITDVPLKEKAIELLKNAVSHAGQTQEEELPPVVQKERSLFDFGEEENEGPSEVDLYLLDKNKDIASLNSYPVVKKLFRQYNTALPTSAPVERLFSVGANVITPNRSKLLDSNFEKHLLLKCNKKFMN